MPAPPSPMRLRLALPELPARDKRPQLPAPVPGSTRATARGSRGGRESREAVLRLLTATRDDPSPQTEEGRLRVILLAAQHALQPALAVSVEVQDSVREACRNEVLDLLIGRLREARIQAGERRFLNAVAQRVVAAVLDGRYAELLGGGGPRDTLSTAIFQPQALSIEATLQPWTIGDVGRGTLGAPPSPLLRVKSSVHRASALLADALLAAATGIERSIGGTPAAALVDRLVAAQILGNALYAGAAGLPFLVDADRLGALTVATDARSKAHLRMLRALWGPLRALSRLDMIGPMLFLSRQPDEVTAWDRVAPSVYATEGESRLQSLLVSRWQAFEAAGAPPPALLPASVDRPLPLFHTLAPDLDQTLDRQAGRVLLSGFEGPGAPRAVLHLPPVPAVPTAEQIRAQNRQLEMLDAFSVAVFGDPMPFHPERLPREATLTQDAFTVGSIPVVKRGPHGRWRFAPHGAAVVRHIYGEPAFKGPLRRELADWHGGGATDTARLPADTAPDARSARLRIFIQMEDDPVMLATGATLSRIHPDDLVWVRLHENGEHQIVRGRSLLANAPPDARIKLIVNGHGHTSWSTKERLLSGRSAPALADQLSRLMRRLGPLPKVSRVALLSCALETPAVQRSYGREFTAAAAALALGRPDMETTVYSDTLILDYGRQRLRRSTRPHPAVAPRRRAAGTTWVFRRDPATGEIHVRDRFPSGGAGALADSACCGILERGADRLPTGRGAMLSNARVTERLRLRRRFLEVVDARRPAGSVLLPRVEARGDGATMLSYLDLASGRTQQRAVTAPADRRALSAGMAWIEGGLSWIDQRGAAGIRGSGMDLLNLGMLALGLHDLAGGAPGGDRYQRALWYLGMTQGGLQAAADTAAMAGAIQSAISAGAGAGLTETSTLSTRLARALAELNALVQTGVVALDLQQLIQALDTGNSAAVSRAAVRFALDAAGSMLAGLAAAADLAGAALLAFVAEGLTVPLAGLAIGITALDEAVSGARARVARDFRPLHQIDRGYDAPLRRMKAQSGAPHEVLLINGWAPIRRIDFQARTVTFADAALGASALHPNQLYFQFGGTRLHDWWVQDGSDRQAEYARRGLDLDLWTAMHKPGRQPIPRAALAEPLLDPGLVLLLLTPPAVDIHYDGYSSSRAGGDFALTHDELIERMQVNTNARFVGDYVSSSSFAKSADQWRYEYRSTLCEVVLDDQPRVLALPSRSEAESVSFTFDDDRRQAIRPLDQSLVHLRLLGRGGRYILALPSDGTVRNPVRILPSEQGRDVWTLLLKGGLARGGKPLELLGEGRLGLRWGGQEIQFEAMNGAVIQLLDPEAPRVRLLLDLARGDAALMLALDPWSEALRPVQALEEALRQLRWHEGGGAAAGLFRPSTPAELRHPIRLSSSRDGAPLSGLMDPVTGEAMLHGERQLMLFKPGVTPAEGVWGIAPVHGGQAGIDEDGRPTLRYDGGRFLEPVTYTFRRESGDFVRAPQLLSGAGEHALLRWLRDHPGWTAQALTDFLSARLGAGVNLAGPGAGSPEPLSEIRFAGHTAPTRRPSGGATYLALWARLDRLRQRAGAAGGVPLRDDPLLARDLARMGIEGFAALAEAGPDARAAALDVEIALQWLVLMEGQSRLEQGVPPSGVQALPPRFSQAQRGALMRLFNELRRLLEAHRAAGIASPWIRLGATPDSSSQLVHRLRDAGVDIRIDAFARTADVRETNREGPEDFYDVQVAGVQLFMRDLTDLLDQDLRGARALAAPRPGRPPESPLQRALAAWGATAGASAQARMTGLPASLLEQVKLARLTVRDNGGEAAPAALGQVRESAAGREIDAATFRLWQAQAALQGLPLDAWYARHAMPDSALEAALREAATEALRDRLVRISDALPPVAGAQSPLALDALVNRQLLAALQRLVPAPGAVREAWKDAGRPGDLFKATDGDGRVHVLLMLRTDTGFAHLKQVDGHWSENGYWAYVGDGDLLNRGLRPAPAPMTALEDFDPAAYLAWRADDPAPVPGGVYVDPVPVDGAYRLFRLRRTDGERYGSFPAPGRISAEWLPIGTSRSLPPAELAALAASPASLEPQRFSRGLIAWWLRQLSLAAAPEGYAHFELRPDLFDATTPGGTRLRLSDDGMLYASLDDGDTTPFRLADDPELRALMRQFPGGTARLRVLLIQTNGRPVDLDGADALDADEIVVLEEADGAPRRIDLDDGGDRQHEVFMDGDDLLVHRRATGRLIRIQGALTAGSEDPLDDEVPDPGLRITRGGGRERLRWPSPSGTPALPLLTTRGTRLAARRDGTDVWIGDQEGWDEMRVLDVAPVSGTEPPVDGTGPAAALLRYRDLSGRWCLAALPAALADLMAREDEGRDWRLAPDPRAAGGALLFARQEPGANEDGSRRDTGSPAGPSSRPQDPWRLASARFAAELAAFEPAGGADNPFVWRPAVRPAAALTAAAALPAG